VSLRPSELDNEVPSFGETEFLKLTAKGSDVGSPTPQESRWCASALAALAATKVRLFVPLRIRRLTGRNGAHCNAARGACLRLL